VTLKKGVDEDEDLRVNELKNHVWQKIGPIAIIEGITTRDKLPKTSSGEILRRVLKAEDLGLEPGDLTTLEDQKAE